MVAGPKGLCTLNGRRFIPKTVTFVDHG